MALIKIYSLGLELDYIDETLSIKVSQEILADDIKIDGSDYPFLIIENENTEKALGNKSAFLTNRKQYFPITVVTTNGMFIGELQVMECFDNYRKCNVRFYPKIYELSKTKIRDFFPTVSVIPGEQNPIPYSEKSVGLLQGAEWWTPYVDDFKTKNFPEVNWNFPTISYPTKFGEIKEDSDWRGYRKHLNLKDEWGIIPNTHIWIEGGVLIHNLNVPVVCPYLLAPLKLALESIGVEYSGTIKNNDAFLNSIVFIPKEDNLSQILKGSIPIDINLHEKPFVEMVNFRYKYLKQYFLTLHERGEYQLEFDVEEKSNRTNMRISIGHIGDINVYEHADLSSNPAQKTGSVRFYVSELISNSVTVVVEYYADNPVDPKVNTLSISQTMKRNGFQMHPTINVARYVPDWTFAEYLNELRKLFNLDFTFNEYYNSLEVNIFDQVLQNKKPFKLNSTKVLSYKNTAHDNVVFSYDNVIDRQLKISLDSSEAGHFPENDKSKLVRNKFKTLNYKNYTIELTKSDEEKAGFGLALYNPLQSPYCLSNINGRTLELENIIENSFKLTLDNYISGSVIEVEQRVTEYELLRILENKFVEIDSLIYYVNNIEYKSKSVLIHVKMELFLISF